MNESQYHKRMVEDQFETYFTEKLWEMIPAFYRTEDGLAESPGVLRSLVEIIAGQAAIIRRSQDRLWEDQYIAYCCEWAIPYIADLLGTRLVSALNTRGRRADVANTIYQRRRSGTLRLLEQLISSITDWEGKIVESFRRLPRTRHGLDPQMSNRLGRFSITPSGGTADLRSPRLSELVDGPFDEYHHTPDFRQARGKDGRYGIHKLIFHLYHLKSYRIQAATPFPLPDHPQFDGLRFSFDPSGRKSPLFMPRNRPEDWDDWKATREWELPGPIRCRLLGHAEYLIELKDIETLQQNYGLSNNAANELQLLQRQHFRNERRLRETLASLQNAAEFLSPAILLPLLEETLIPDCGKAALLPEVIRTDTGIPEGVISSARTTAGNLLAGIPNGSPEKRLIIDPENGLFAVWNGTLATSPEVSYYYGFSGPFGAGGYTRRSVEDMPTNQEISGGGGVTAAVIFNDGVLQINDSKTYGPISDKLSVKNLRVQAKTQERPYLRLGSNWVLNTGINKESFVSLEGLWLGATGPDQAIILRGDYECVTISHCTFDPGGDVDFLGNTIYPLALIIEARIDQLIIDASIVGPIQVQGSGLIESLVLCDTIVHATNSAVKAIKQDLGELKMDRVTILGEIEAHRLYASEALITGITDITDTQHGCFRFSIAPSGSRLPRPYPHPLIPFKDFNHWFTSQRFGHPAYAQLSETAPPELRRGAENGSEIGVFNSLNNPIKFDSIQAKVREYMPFGLLPIFINET